MLSLSSLDLATFPIVLRRTNAAQNQPFFRDDFLRGVNNKALFYRCLQRRIKKHQVYFMHYLVPSEGIIVVGW